MRTLLCSQSILVLDVARRSSDLALVLFYYLKLNKWIKRTTARQTKHLQINSPLFCIATTDLIASLKSFCAHTFPIKLLALFSFQIRPFGWFLEVRGFRAAVRRQGGFGGERPKWSPAVGGIFFWYLRGYSKECLYRIAYVSTPALKKKDL